jgi:acetyl esterase/lipase
MTEAPAPTSEAPTPEPTTNDTSPTPEGASDSSAGDSQADPVQTEKPKRIYFDVPYVPDGDLKQRLDIFLPEAGEKPYPTVLAIHGGGFRSGSRSFYIRIAGRLNELGYAVVSIDYRLTPRFTYPAQVEDAFCALAWLHANHTTYGFDKQRIVVMGGSAGGNLAAMVGTVDTPDHYLENCPYTLPASDWVQGAVIFYGSFDFTNIDGYPILEVKNALEPYWGAKFDEMPSETLAQMSPKSWVDGGEPPFLLIHGTLDSSIPSWMSEDFASTLEEAEVEVELLLLEAGHAFELKSLSSPEMVQSLAAIEPFLKEIFKRQS